MGNAGSEKQSSSRGELGVGRATSFDKAGISRLAPEPAVETRSSVRWVVSKGPTLGPRAQVREEGERGLGASGCLPFLWEGPVYGFPPSALQARNCSTKPLPPPTAGRETLPGLGSPLRPKALVHVQLPWGWRN